MNLNNVYACRPAMTVKAQSIGVQSSTTVYEYLLNRK
jgi:hypothetical protein